MTPFPRADYDSLKPYDPGRAPVELDLSDNTNLWGPNPAALSALKDPPPDALTRYPSVYAAELKTCIGARYDLPVDCIVTGCGSDDLLDSTFRASTVPPGLMTYPDPTFSMVRDFARMNGIGAMAVPWAKAEIDPGRLLVDQPDLVYLCRPNNPTGAAVSRDWLESLLALAGPDGPLFVLDEAYADFGADNFLHDALESDRLLVLRTFSKLFGLAGLRVGFAVGPPALVREVEKSRGPYKVSQMASLAAMAALRDDSGWLERVVTDTRTNRDRLARELTARGLRPLPSQSNFLLFSVGPADAIAVNQALRARGVAARPFQDLPEVGDALRVTVGPWESMERFLAALDELLGRGVGEGGAP